MSFPKDFTWGSATASYQIEGAAFEDGKGWSVWDMMVRKANAIHENQVGDEACDHYHRYKEDVALMKQIGLKGYRMSISWPRVLPEGKGKPNSKGLEFYDRLIDALLAAGIQPWVTLFHWDYPYELYCRGGWLNPESPDWFAEYASLLVRRYSDRVSHWMTHNEPQCTLVLGHQDGIHAPGDKLGWAQVLRATHNLLLSHGKAVQALRAGSKGLCRIGMAPVGHTYTPISESKQDVDAARETMFSIPGRTLWNNSWFMDPMFLGKYPEDGVKVFGADMPAINDGDMKTIAQKLDFLGFNNYQDALVKSMPGAGGEIVRRPAWHPRSSLGWNVTPDSLYWGAKFFYERYRLPIVVTENGMANVDWIALDGKVHDPQRIDFLHRYLKGLKRACAEGVPVLGYFVWTLLDNFEWAEGFRQRFGLVYMDYPTQNRILKDSAYWYRDVIASNGAEI